MWSRVGMPVSRRRRSRLFISVVLWCVLTALVVAFVLVPGLDASGTAVGHGSHYVREQEGHDGAIVFVHGVMGDGISTWTNPNTKAYWPQLLTEDRAFDNYNIFVYEYDSPRLGKSYSIDEIVENMRLVLESSGVLGHREINFLAHSMGGLVTRGFLVRYQRITPKIPLIYFYSTPTTGSQWANIVEFLSKNRQFHDMLPMGANSFIENLQSSWLAAKLDVCSFCAYEVKDTDGIDIVARQSATALCTESLEPIPEDHISIVKPADRGSIPYIAFKTAFTKTHDPKGPRVCKH